MGETPAKRRRRRGSALLFGSARGRGKAALLIPAALLLGVLAGVGLFDKLLMPRVVREGSEVRIPAVTGKEVQQAESILRGAGLTPMRGAGQHHSQMQRGLVLEVSPPAGLSVKKGRQVFLTPSLGPIDRRVPDLIGQSMRMTRMALAEAALRIGRIDYAATDLVPADQVLAATPEPGAPVPENGQISLLVSSARAPVACWMPDLAGRDGEEAVAWLKGAGLRVAVAKDPDAGDVVTGQDPGCGAPFWPDTKISLRFGAGRPRGLDRQEHHPPVRGRRW
jgi:eukaryotic-like serine/threonine-protein kinase